MKLLNINRGKTGYLPSLDGWRAIAIVGVLITHDLPWTIFHWSTAKYKGLGGYGVELFFAISGFLITTRILEEEKLCGYFDIKRFYIRRVLRIQPAALAYLSVIALLIAFGVVHDRWLYWLSAVVSLRNYAWYSFVVPRNGYFTGHFWTLSVEEHFYILLSATLFFVKRRRLPILSGLYVLFQVIAHLERIHGVLQVRNTEVQIHFLLLPAIVAVLMQHEEIAHLVKTAVHPWLVWLGTLLCLTVAVHRSQAHRWLPLLYQADFAQRWPYVVSYGFLLFILSTMFHPRSWTTRVLETPPLRFVGRISYSLYLWHVLFFFRFAGDIGIKNRVLLALSGRPTKQIAAFAVATISYYLIEKPLVRLGHKLAPAATPGRPELADLPVETPVDANAKLTV